MKKWNIFVIKLIKYWWFLSKMYVFSYRAQAKLPFKVKRHDFLATPVLLKQYPMLFWSWLREARPNTLEMKYFCLQTCKMHRYLCKVYVFNISKIDIFGKNAWFSGNTPLYWNNTSRCSDHNWGGQGPIHYQAKGKKMCLPWQVDL